MKRHAILLSLLWLATAGLAAAEEPLRVSIEPEVARTDDGYAFRIGGATNLPDGGLLTASISYQSPTRLSLLDLKRGEVQNGRYAILLRAQPDLPLAGTYLVRVECDRYRQRDRVLDSLPSFESPATFDEKWEVGDGRATEHAYEGLRELYRDRLRRVKALFDEWDTALTAFQQQERSREQTRELLSDWLDRVARMEKENEHTPYHLEMRVSQRAQCGLADLIALLLTWGNASRPISDGAEDESTYPALLRTRHRFLAEYDTFFSRVALFAPTGTADLADHIAELEELVQRLRGRLRKSPQQLDRSMRTGWMQEFSRCLYACLASSRGAVDTLLHRLASAVQGLLQPGADSSEKARQQNWDTVDSLLKQIRTRMQTTSQ